MIKESKLIAIIGVAIFCISQILAFIFTPQIPIVDRLLLAIVCGYGCLLVYEFLFKKTMSVTGAVVPYGEKKGLRLFLFILGCAAIIYGYRSLILGIPVLS